MALCGRAEEEEGKGEDEGATLDTEMGEGAGELPLPVPLLLAGGAPACGAVAAEVGDVGRGGAAASRATTGMRMKREAWLESEALSAGTTQKASQARLKTSPMVFSGRCARMDFTCRGHGGAPPAPAGAAVEVLGPGSAVVFAEGASSSSAPGRSCTSSSTTSSAGPSWEMS